MPKTPWTGEAETILKREHARRSAEEIAAMIGCSSKTIYRKIEQLNLTPYHPARRNMTRREKLMLGAAGLDAPESDVG